jgi:protein-S-isoprenylcysteine O-methyltransferase Ste14
VAASDTPGVIAPPPLLYAAFFLVGWALDYFAADGFPAGGAAPWWTIGTVLALAGILLGLAAVYQFFRAGTNVLPEQPTLAIVTRGPYRLTRNPMYAGLTLFYAGLAIAWQRPITLALLVPLLLVMHYGVVLREERYLAARFGDGHLAYKRSVRRWL